MTPGVHDRQPMSFCSVIGRASMSARSYYGAAFGIGFPASFDPGQHARSGDRTVLDAQLREPVSDEGCRVVFLERQFGVCMQVAAEFSGIHSCRLKYRFCNLDDVVGLAHRVVVQDGDARFDQLPALGDGPLGSDFADGLRVVLVAQHLAPEFLGDMAAEGLGQ